MQIYPTMELLGGRCVTLDKGRLESPMLWHVDPVETARGWAAEGASWMHLTDFDAVQGQGNSADLVEEIIRSAGLNVQLAGGMRSREQVTAWIDRGAARVVVGTLAAKQPALVAELAKFYPDQIVLALDIWQGQVMTEGWREAAAMTPEALLQAYEAVPLAGVIVTDIDSDLRDAEASMGVISGLAPHVRAPLIASGVVRGEDDVARLKYIPGIDGALVGRALFRKTATLKALLAQSTPGKELRAEFL